jgi:RNA polymerase-binding transcription factor DksA
MARRVLLQVFMATSADILGSIRKTKIPARWAGYYSRLCAERDRLLERDYSSAEAFQPKLDDLSDAASEESERGLTMVAATATQGTIIEVLQAIQRIERGTFGVCELTGEPIAAERLNSIPWTRYCFEGQRQLEQAGLVRRSALPALEGLAESQPSEEAELEDNSG